MLKHLGSILLCILLAGTASATFELEDPAAEMRENTPEKIAEYLGERACFDFLLASSKDKKTYQADLVRIRDYVLDSGLEAQSIPGEARLKDFCVENPKTFLRDAVNTLVRQPRS